METKLAFSSTLSRFWFLFKFEIESPRTHYCIGCSLCRFSGDTDNVILDRCCQLAKTGAINALDLWATYSAILQLAEDLIAAAVSQAYIWSSCFHHAACQLSDSAIE